MWSTWAEHIAYRNPRIASMAQFLLSDDVPDKSFRRSDPRRWRTWQSGLYDSQGQPKPAAAEYVIPIRIEPAEVPSGQPVTVFGIARAAPKGLELIARIQFKTAAGDWETLKELPVNNPRTYIETTVVPPSSGELRILWVHPPTGGEAPTRAVRVTVR